MSDAEKQEFAHRLFAEVQECYCTAITIGNALFSEANKKHLEQDDWIAIAQSWHKMVSFYLDESISETICRMVMFNIS